MKRVQFLDSNGDGQYHSTAAQPLKRSKRLRSSLKSKGQQAANFGQAHQPAGQPIAQHPNQTSPHKLQSLETLPAPPKDNKAQANGSTLQMTKALVCLVKFLNSPKILLREGRVCSSQIWIFIFSSVSIAALGLSNYIILSRNFKQGNPFKGNSIAISFLICHNFLGRFWLGLGFHPWYK